MNSKEFRTLVEQAKIALDQLSRAKVKLSEMKHEGSHAYLESPHWIPRAEPLPKSS